MAPIIQPYENDALKFPLLQAISAPGYEACNSLTSKDIDALGVEITRAYKRCSVPESSVSSEEREVNEVMLGCIGTVDKRLQSNSQTSSEAGATFMLFRRVILTPTIVSALLEMMDPKVRTGRAQCHAIWHLHELRQNKFSWNIRLDDGTSFAMGLIKAMAKSLDPILHAEHKKICCRGITLCSLTAWSLLGEALGVCKYPPEQVVHVLLDYDWPAILQRTDAALAEDNVFFDLSIFIHLHKWCVGALAKDSNNQKAKELLHRLGSCHTLFQRSLKRIISGAIWFDNSRSKPDMLGPVVHYLKAAMNCLVPVPDDIETDALVRRARMCIMEAFMVSMMGEVTVLAANPERSAVLIGEINMLLDRIDDGNWQALKSESDNDRWARFQQVYPFSKKHVEAERALLAKKVKKNDYYYKQLKQGPDMSGGDMCTNCHVLEANLQLHSKLMKCAGCRQIMYCSRSCQMEHWKKIHKKQCSRSKS
jgi:hypothetical protein